MEEYDNLPAKIKAILDTHDENKCMYKEAERILKELNKVGWTCDYGLCGEIFDIKPMKVTMDTFIDIGKMLGEFCGGRKKDEQSEADKLRSEITFLREELNKQHEELKRLKPIKSREEIEEQLKKEKMWYSFANMEEQSKGLINALEWVLKG